MGALATFLIGPVFAEKNLISMIVGEALLGFAMGISIYPNMAEMIEASHEAFA